jgi:tetratricopeptide (TPR) repeat protein
MQDCRGNPLSTASPDAAAALDAATAQLAAFHGDPVGTIVAALKAQPDFVMGHAFLATVFATSMDRTFDGYMDRALAAAEPLLAQANDRERAYVAAAQAWRAGDFDRATEGWGAIAVAHPHDIFAIQMAQQGDFFLGRALMLRDRVARVLPRWDETVPGYGYLLGMHAFGLEETGDYRRAEAAGREAVARDPQDAWGAHAVAHVMEMEGRADEGVQWLRATQVGWDTDGLLACHNAWHLALAELERGNTPAVLDLYDRGILALGLKQALQICDAAALLWRLTTLGHDVGDRWTAVADAWESRAEQGLYAFNDMHAMMAFGVTGRTASAARLMRAAERAAESRLANGLMTREAGLPVLHGIAAFAAGDYTGALDHLVPALPKLPLGGGSHAQRDVFQWTATEAALRAGNRTLADALIAERLAAKPHSPLNRAWAARAAAYGAA